MSKKSSKPKRKKQIISNKAHPLIKEIQVGHFQKFGKDNTIGHVAYWQEPRPLDKYKNPFADAEPSRNSPSSAQRAS